MLRLLGLPPELFKSCYFTARLYFFLCANRPLVCAFEVPDFVSSKVKCDTKMGVLEVGEAVRCSLPSSSSSGYQYTRSQRFFRIRRNSVQRVFECRPSSSRELLRGRVSPDMNVNF